MIHNYHTTNDPNLYSIEQQNRYHFFLSRSEMLWTHGCGGHRLSASECPQQPERQVIVFLHPLSVILFTSRLFCTPDRPSQGVGARLTLCFC